MASPRYRVGGTEAKVKMLILMPDTSGGHRASRRALEAALEEFFPGGVEVTTVIVLKKHSPWTYSTSMLAYQAGNGRVWMRTIQSLFSKYWYTLFHEVRKRVGTPSHMK